MLNKQNININTKKEIKIKKTYFYNKLDLFELLNIDKVEFFKQIIKNKDKDIFFSRNENNYRAIDIFLEEYYNKTINNINNIDDDTEFLISLYTEPRAIVLNKKYFTMPDNLFFDLLKNLGMQENDCIDIINFRSKLTFLDYDNGFSLYKDLVMLNKEEDKEYTVSKKVAYRNYKK